METKVYFICGRPRLAVKVATCNNGEYINYPNINKGRK